MVRILLIEDNSEISQAYRLTMSRRGHEVSTELSGAGGLLAAGQSTFDVIVLDGMLPDIDGFEVCKQIRRYSAIPIIMLTARGDDSDVVGGLESGADDYLVKPVSPVVLEARIRAVLRRNVAAAPPPEADDTQLSYGPLEVNLNSLVATKSGVELALTRTELLLLIDLMKNIGRVRSRAQLLERVWGNDADAVDRNVDAGVQRLRAKIEDTPATPTLLTTVRGFGYRIG